VEYRKDIDGLRAIAVLLVIFFHSGITIFSGGFVGVDVFFVISGYLITTLISNEIRTKQFTFRDFYKRRALRLLPSLNITLLLVLIFGFVFYNNNAFDKLGKEIFYSSLGLANILFAQGVDYFANDDAYRPLIHLWSLGVEEQFYIFWPFILIFLLKFNNPIVIKCTLLLFLGSIVLSEYAISSGSITSYYYLQFRAFELLTGAIVALSSKCIGTKNNNFFSVIGAGLIIIPMLLFNNETHFPGVNALFPCIGAGLIIYYFEGTALSKLLGNKLLVYIGLISYPLYLFHQPLISFMSYFELVLSPWETAISVLAICVPLSWIIYRFVEQPIRKAARASTTKSKLWVSGLVAFIPFFVIVGAIVAKEGGLPWRFKVLNEFAYELSQKNKSPFHEQYKRGFQVDRSGNGEVLFIGDSVLQNYIVPLSHSIFNGKEVDIVSRGGCILLNEVEFKDSFSDISCDGLREQLYSINTFYDTIVISQSWALYDGDILNAIINTTNDYNLEKWHSFLAATIAHFKPYANNIIIIGAHPSIHGTLALQPNIFLTKEEYQLGLDKLHIENLVYLNQSRDFFDEFGQDEKVSVIHPYDLWCQPTCITHDGTWAYFIDSQHVSSASTDFLKYQLDIYYSGLVGK
jgi:peptidoglycan/LPS O-acetylase OafA/YrhL